MSLCFRGVMEFWWCIFSVQPSLFAQFKIQNRYINKSLKNERSDRRYIAMKWHWNQSRRLILNIKYGLLWKTVDRMVLIQLIDFQLFSFCTKTHLHHATKKFTVYSNQWCPVADTPQTIATWLNLVISPLDKLDK